MSQLSRPGEGHSFQLPTLASVPLSFPDVFFFAMASAQASCYRAEGRKQRRGLLWEAVLAFI